MSDKMQKIWSLWDEYQKGTLKESGFPRIKNMLQGAVPSVDSVAFATAANPQGEPLSPKENKERNEQFERALRDANYGFIRIRGKFGSPEKSYMIPNISRDHIVALGAEFDQEAIIWGSRQGDKMVFEYIEGHITVQKRDVVLFGPDIQSKEDYYSQERQSAGRKFVIPFFDEEYEIAESINAPVPLLELKQSPENRKLISEVRTRENKLRETPRVEKYYWHHRGILNTLLKQLDVE